MRGNLITYLYNEFGWDELFIIQKFWSMLFVNIKYLIQKLLEAKFIFFNKS